MMDQGSDSRQSGGLYQWYVVFILALIYMISSIDRTMISIVAEPVKLEFGLSDSELGVLTGLVFAASFAICGVPLGLLADRFRRTRLLAFLVAVWSGLTLLTGTAQSYLAMALARIGVGASEAGASPASMSLITDYFPVERRGTALSFFYVSTPIGVSLGFALGSYFAGHFGWRASFFIAGVPGFILALLLLTTVREPRRGAFELGAPEVEGAPRLGFGEIVRTLKSIPPLPLLMLAGICVVVAQAGLSAFATPFLMRVHNVGIQQAGYALGMAHFIPGIAGVIGGGILADRMRKRSAHAGPLAVALLISFAAPMAFAALLVDDWRLCVILFGAHFFLNATYYGTHFSTYLSLAPVRMRGTLSALLAVLMTLMGYGMGPVVAGASSDLFSAAGVEDPLRWAMITTACGFVIAGLLYFAVARSIARMEKEGILVLAPAGLIGRAH